MLKKLNNKQKIILTCLALCIISLVLIIVNSIKVNINKNDEMSYTRENTQIFDGVTSETTSKDEVVSGDSEINKDKISEKQEYVDSGLVSEFIDVDFSYIDVNRTSLLEYFNKLVNYYEENNTEAMLANLNYDYIKEYNIDSSNVKEFYRKNGFTKDYRINYVQFWGVNDTIFIVKLKNDISGATHTVGINMKMESRYQIFNIYPEQFFKTCGFEIKNNDILKNEEKDLMDNFNTIKRNEYNTINI